MIFSLVLFVAVGTREEPYVAMYGIYVSLEIFRVAESFRSALLTFVPVRRGGIVFAFVMAAQRLAPSCGWSTTEGVLT